MVVVEATESRSWAMPLYPVQIFNDGCPEQTGARQRTAVVHSSSQSEDEVSSRKMSVGDMRSAGNGVETQKSFRCKKKQHDEESSGRRRP